MPRYCLAALCSIGILLAPSAFTATVTIDFGTGSGIISGWAGASSASNSSAGVAVANALLLHVGELQITGSGGNVFCDEGAVAGTCGTSVGLTTSTAYGLGVSNGRLDGAESIALTLIEPNYIVKLVSFSLTGFSGSEQATYTIDGVPTTVSAPATNVALDTFLVNGGSGTSFTNSVVWSIPVETGGNYSLASITLDASEDPVPEPATMAIVGGALMGLGMIRRRKRA